MPKSHRLEATPNHIKNACFNKIFLLKTKKDKTYHITNKWGYSVIQHSLKDFSPDKGHMVSFLGHFLAFAQLGGISPSVPYYNTFLPVILNGDIIYPICKRQGVKNKDDKYKKLKFKEIRMHYFK